MNAMQELAIKYPTLWEHIAKGGKVRGYQERLVNQNVGIVGVISSIDADDELDITILADDDGELYSVERIELIPLPKRVPTRDLGKAVNWFDWHSAQCMYRDELNELYYLYGEKKVYFEMIREVVFLRRSIPDWWPEELMEDDNG